MSNERVAFLFGVLVGAYVIPYLLKIAVSFADRGLNQ